MSKNLKKYEKIPQNACFFGHIFLGYLRKWTKIYEPDTLLRMCENRHSESDV